MARRGLQILAWGDVARASAATGREDFERAASAAAAVTPLDPDGAAIVADLLAQVARRRATWTEALGPVDLAIRCDACGARPALRDDEDRDPRRPLVADLVAPTPSGKVFAPVRVVVDPRAGLRAFAVYAPDVSLVDALPVARELHAALVARARRVRAGPSSAA